MAFRGTNCKLKACELNFVDGFQYPLILPQNGYPPLSTVKGSLQGKGLQEYPPQKRLQAIALQNNVIQATDAGDGYRVRITLDIPIRLTRDEVERLIGVTDDWPGWCDSPRLCLTELGLKLELAIATVGGAK
jgi:hypothetical protein